MNSEVLSLTPSWRKSYIWQLWLLVEPEWAFKNRILQNMQTLSRRSLFKEKWKNRLAKKYENKKFFFPKFSNWHLPNWAYLFMEEVCNSATRWIGWKLKDKTARNGIFTLFQKTTKSFTGRWITSNWFSVLSCSIFVKVEFGIFTENRRNIFSLTRKKSWKQYTVAA